MKRSWIGVTAAMLTTAGWAAAQAPSPSATEKSAPDKPQVTAAAAAAAGMADPYLAPPAPLPLPAGNLGPGPSGPPTGYAPSDWAENWPQPYRVWASGDFLVWKIRSGSLPSLTQSVPVGVISASGSITTINNSPTGTTSFTQVLPAVLLPVSVQSVSSLNTDGSLNFSEQLGGRFAAGVWLDSEETFSLEGAFFFLNRETIGFNSTTTGTSPSQGVFTLPVSNTFIVTTTSVLTGTASQSSSTQTLPLAIVRQASNTVVGTASTEMWGAELNARCASPSLGAVSGLVGFRYLNFKEDLNVHSSSQLSQAATFPDTGVTDFPTNLSFSSADSIKTRNEFYGGQVGLDLDMYVGRFFADIRAKMALGVMHETANVFGVSTVPINAGTTTTTLPGGLFSSPFDQGAHSRNRIAWIPEINVKLGYQLTPGLRAYVGYDFLWLSNVLRPGDQTGIATSGVQATVAGTTSQITVNQPTFRFNDTSVWVNGINFGLEFRY
jgi:hypothetical protein